MDNNQFDFNSLNIQIKPKKKRASRLRTKLLMSSFAVMVVPLALLIFITWNQIVSLGYLIRDISVYDTTEALNESARNNIERMTTDTAASIAGFLSERDSDILLLSQMMPSDSAYKVFSENRNSRLRTIGQWRVSDDGMTWVPAAPASFDMHDLAQASLSEPFIENRLSDRYFDGEPVSNVNQRQSENYLQNSELFPIYDEITFIDLTGIELFKFVNEKSPKINYPLNPEKLDISNIENTYISAEVYWDEVLKLQPGEIFISDLTGMHVSTNYTGMYTPGVLGGIQPDHPNYRTLLETAGLNSADFMEAAKEQAFAGMENPVGKRFEGIIRWITPVVDFDGEIWGYVTMALNHDHLMEFIDYITPMPERYVPLASAQDGNYVMLWDYKNRNIAYPRHAFIFGYDEETREPANISLKDSFALIDIQMPEWLSLTENGGSGSFFALRDDLKKFTTAGAIPFETGKFSSTEQGNERGFGFVAISTGFDDFTAPAVLMEEKIIEAINNDSRDTAIQLIVTSIGIFALILVVSILVSYSFTSRINQLIKGLSRFQSGDRQFRMHSKANDEFGNLADSFDEMADSVESSLNKAEQASSAKGNFLSNMSHEIRTPLNAIIGMTSIAAASNDLKKKDYSLKKIDEASKHLLGIINDILDVSKIEANKFTLSEAEFEAADMIRKVIGVINFRIEQKKQKLSVNIDPNIPACLIGDDQRLAQVISNLLSNSVKFTAEGGSIHLEMKLTAEYDEQCEVMFVISDTGIGISKEQQQHLFTSFEQAEASTTRKFGGTGLGLAICKKIVEMMNGDIWVESELGSGAVISFTVQLGFDRSGLKKVQVSESISDRAQAVIADADFEGYTVLLAEDLEINREIVVALLEPTKLEIECAGNGMAAVDAFLDDPHRYDMIFMDIQMPEMDGYTATEIIRASGADRATEIPIVAMTANAFKEDIEKCLEAGMNAHLAKPLQYELVIETLEKYLKE